MEAEELEFLKNGQPVVESHGIALAQFAAMYKIVDKQRVMFQHYAAFETVAVLQGSVFAVYGSERASSLKFDDAHAVGQPSNAEPVARNKFLDPDGKMVLYNVGFFA